MKIDSLTLDANNKVVGTNLDIKPHEVKALLALAIGMLYESGHITKDEATGSYHISPLVQQVFDKAKENNENIAP
jgi:hypothetical protein